MRRGGQAARLPMSRAVPDIIQNPCSVFVCTCLYFGAFGAMQPGRLRSQPCASPLVI
jgi:hypothetical protein